MQTVSINRVYLIRSLLFALLLLWPLLLFGRPAYMVDSAAYQNGGERAVTFVLRKLHLAKPRLSRLRRVPEIPRTLHPLRPLPLRKLRKRAKIPKSPARSFIVCLDTSSVGRE